VYGVVTIKQMVITSGGKRWLFSFILLEHDSCLLNWIRVDFTPQIQIKQMVKTIHDSPPEGIPTLA
jgi:hypothetical protein